ncbi:putative ATP-dependent helicase YqhH [Nitrosopumilus zosterae]|uniref:Putative ATP-dependent helicase YqhH n=1 Tax=Nitrosopumilus zosterae TaxID=718286 RepID=A0A2S2KR11_9ARCH|nr:helicase-related protein [Nitrosopumilus zosterae]BDQ30596.1 SNF2-related protein [Nitrosopumilus zosterae]GBH33971.1 putative ATP-dependent helicase YqhH [Nitrosopumilus zosterae]
MKLLHNNLNGILISDGVGVGKTISAGYILLFLISKLNQSGIVVCPPSLLIKWKEELESKFDLKGIVVTNIEELATMENELQTIRSKKRPTVYIMPSSILNKIKFGEKTQVSVIVFDEIHNFRNDETLGYRNARKISLHAEYRVGLSATPINNSIDDFISELSILFPFNSREAVSILIDDLWDQNKSMITNSLVTRFTKEHLGIHFAKRIVKTAEIEYPQEYIRKIKNIISKIPTTRDSFFEKVTYYRLAASSSQAFSKSVGIKEELIEQDPKISAASKIMDEIKNEKWVIFCEFSETVNAIEKEFVNRWTTFVMTGETPLLERQKIINNFRESEKSILIMTPVGSEGLDVQFCSAVMNYDLHWNPMRMEQRIGRIDRVGQEKDKIYIVNLLVNGSIDLRILQVIEEKLSLISNSIFELSSLIKQKSDKVIEIFDKRSFDSEFEISKKFLQSLKYWESFPLEDYSIIPKINIELCNAEKLLKSSKQEHVNWFKNNKEYTKWKNDFIKKSKPIQERINLYS